MPLLYKYPHWSETQYAYPGQVCQWAFISALCFWLHRDTAPYSGPGCAHDSSQQAATLPSAAFGAWHAAVPGGSSFNSAPLAATLPGTVEVPGELGVPSLFGRSSDVVCAEHSAHSVDADLTPGALIKDKIVASLEIDSGSASIHNGVSPNGGWVGAAQSNTAAAAGGGAVSIAPASSSLRIDDEFSLDATGVANESLMQVHKLTIALSEWVLFGSFATIMADILIAVCFPTLPRCGQVNLFTSDWAYTVRSLSDLLH